MRTIHLRNMHNISTDNVFAIPPMYQECCVYVSNLLSCICVHTMWCVALIAHRKVGNISYLYATLLLVDPRQLVGADLEFRKSEGGGLYIVHVQVRVGLL